MFRYFLELRNRFLVLGFSKISLVIAAYSYKETVLFLFTKSVACEGKQRGFYFIATSVTDVFSAYVSLTSAISNVLVALFMFYHFLLFISPALFKFEYDGLKSVCAKLFLFWCFGTFLFYNFLFQAFWEFFLSFQGSTVYQPLSVYFEAKINECIELYLFFYFVCITVSQLFATFFCFLAVAANRLTLVKRFRKLTYVTFIGIATILTPPDIISQVAVFLIFSVFYEIIVAISVLKFRFNSVAS